MGLGLVDKPHLQRFKSHLDTIFATKVNNTDYATTENCGIVKADGTTITVDNDGTIHGSNQYELPTASTTTLGGVKVDGRTITIQDGIISSNDLNYSTTEQDTKTLWIDGSTIYQKTYDVNVSCTGGQWNEVANVPPHIQKLIHSFAENDSYACNPDVKIDGGRFYIYPINSFTLKTLTVYYTKDSAINYAYDLTWEEANDYTWSDLSETQWKETTA